MAVGLKPATAGNLSTQHAETPISAGFRRLFWLVAVLTLVVGATMFLLPVQSGTVWWPWQLTPLVSRYLGALFVGVGLGAVAGAQQRQWSQVRVMVIPGLVFTGLGTIAALIHFDRFNPARLATWLFFALYIGVFAAALVLALRHEAEYRRVGG